jgi:hypothetical protein
VVLWRLLFYTPLTVPAGGLLLQTVVLSCYWRRCRHRSAARHSPQSRHASAAKLGRRPLKASSVSKQVNLLHSRFTCSTHSVNHQPSASAIAQDSWYVLQYVQRAVEACSFPSLSINVMCGLICSSSGLLILAPQSSHPKPFHTRIQHKIFLIRRSVFDIPVIVIIIQRWVPLSLRQRVLLSP